MIRRRGGLNALVNAGFATRALWANRGKIARAARFASRRFGTFTANRRRQIRSGQGVTLQHDRRRIYRKRSMPRRKKRRWRKFVRKVQTISEKELGTRTVVFNHQLSSLNTTSGQQILAQAVLYSFKSTNVFTDLYSISQLENTSDPTSTAGSTVDDTTKYIFHSGVLDLTLRNDSSYYDGEDYTYSGEAKLELDIYEVSCSKTARDASGNFNSFVSLLQDGESMTKIIGGSGTQVALQSRGSTPWDLPAALSKFGIKIWKKTKYFIPNNDTITYQIRDPRRHVFLRRELTQAEGINYPKATRGLVIIAKLVPGLTIGNTSGTYQQSLVMGVTRKYMYKVEGMNDTRDSYINT